MTAPKKGDRVRVTYEAEWGYQRDLTGRSLGVVKHWSVDRDGFIACTVPDNATVEVLASPVYVNHETTEYRVGDVVRDADSQNPGSAWLHIGGRPGSEQVWQMLHGTAGTTANRSLLPKRLRLLVRGGQVIQP